MFIACFVLHIAIATKFLPTITFSVKQRKLFLSHENQLKHSTNRYHRLRNKQSEKGKHDTTTTNGSITYF